MDPLMVDVWCIILPSSTICHKLQHCRMDVAAYIVKQDAVACIE